MLPILHYSAFLNACDLKVVAMCVGELSAKYVLSFFTVVSTTNIMRDAEAPIA